MHHTAALANHQPLTVTYREAHSHLRTGLQTDRQTSRQTGRQTGAHAFRQVDRQTCRCLSLPTHLQHIREQVWVDAEVGDAAHQVSCSPRDAQRLALAAQEADHASGNRRGGKHGAGGQPVQAQPAALKHELNGEQRTSGRRIKCSRHACSEAAGQQVAAAALQLLFLPACRAACWVKARAELSCSRFAVWGQEGTLLLYHITMLLSTACFLPQHRAVHPCSYEAIPIALLQPWHVLAAKSSDLPVGIHMVRF